MNVIEYKSNVFSLLMEEPEYAIEVYNVLNGSSYGSDMIEIKKHNSGVILSVRNDASFLVDSYLNLYEHQSTYCPNMPLRFMIYFSAIIQDIIAENEYDLYGRKKIMLPTPKFVVFYNGLQNRPEKEIMRLSDAFEKKAETYQLELKCEVYNINPGSNESVVNSSRVLHGYRTFVETTRSYIENNVEIGKAVSMSVDECIRKNILSDFFRDRRREIEEVAALDFTFERREKLIRRDSYEEGEKNGREAGMKVGMKAGMKAGIEKERIEFVIKKVKRGMKLSEVADVLEVSEAEISPIYDAVVKNAPEYDVENILMQLSLMIGESE